MKTLFFLKLNIILVGLFLLAITHTVVQAQFINDVSISVNPTLPGANERVSLQLSSFSTDLNRAQITWVLGGEKRDSGIGKTNFQFVTKSLGSTSRITVTVDTADRRSFSKSVVIRPAEIDVLWEAFSYVPPFYKGKAIPPFNSTVILTAMPELVNGRGARSDPREVVYEWKQASISLGNASGYGKRRVVINTGFSPRRLQTITVSASTLNGTLRAENIVGIPPSSDPMVLFYKKSPLQGIEYGRALRDSFTLTDKEVTLRAEPYFFSLDNILRGELRYAWNVNNSPIDIEGSQKEVTFRREIQGGTSLVSLKIKNTDLFRVLQEAHESLSIKY